MKFIDDLKDQNIHSILKKSKIYSILFLFNLSVKIEGDRNVPYKEYLEM